MRALNATATIHSDHTLTAPVPSDVAAGTRRVIIVLEDTEGSPPDSVPLQFSPHAVGPVDPESSYRREEIYGDEGR